MHCTCEETACVEVRWHVVPEALGEPGELLRRVEPRQLSIHVITSWHYFVKTIIIQRSTAVQIETLNCDAITII